MTSLLSVDRLTQSHGSQPLFCNIRFSIKEGDRIGLIGKNGAGKTSLIKILAGLETPETGHVSYRQQLKIGYASQSPDFPPLSLEEVLLQVDTHESVEEKQTKARILLSKAHFTDFQRSASELSGGWKKRLDIVRALMQGDDLLLLDEPTNHLDMEGIEWLEKLLKQERKSFLLVSHDRYFLETVTNRTMELNSCYPEGLFIVDGPLSAFSELKSQFLLGQEERERSLASKLRTELEWLKRSPKARTTKSRARIQHTLDMQEEFTSLRHRNKTTRVDMAFSESEKETRKLLSVKNLSKSFGTTQLFKGIDLTLTPGMRLGIVGKNGTGKTTFLKLLAGTIQPDAGTRKIADQVRIVYFDQHREQISPESTPKEALSPQGDFVEKNGQRIHVHGWAKRFLFSPDRMKLPVRCLSGGERARIHIARLMLEPADILLLDEPTNDLDIDTLEVIEEQLEEFQGAVVLISHDRCLMDSICTSILGLGNETEEYLFADYRQWEEAIARNTQKTSPATPQKQEKALRTEQPIKLSYKEKKELEEIEKRIETEEEKHASLVEQVSTGGTTELYTALGEAQKRIEQLYQRWQELSNKSQGIST